MTAGRFTPGALAIVGLIGALVAVSWAYQWTRVEMPAPSRARRASVACAGEPPGNRYFPAGVFRPADGSSDRYHREGLAYILGFLSEPPLFCGGDQLEAYRFLIIASGKAPAAVRVHRTQREMTLTAVVLGGTGRKDWVVSRRHDVPLTKQQWADLMGAVNRADFWNTASIDQEDWNINDGQMWLLEGRRDVGYHVVERTSPPNGPFRNACLTLLALAGIELKDVALLAPARGLDARPKPVVP